MNCLICDKENPLWSWTDTHGVAQCMNCGTPYRLLHYEGEGDNRKVINKPPECIVLPEYIGLLKEYHQTFKTNIPGGCSMGYAETTQELATKKEAKHFYAWFNQKTERKIG